MFSLKKDPQSNLERKRRRSLWILAIASLAMAVFCIWLVRPKGAAQASVPDKQSANVDQKQGEKSEAQAAKEQSADSLAKTKEDPEQSSPAPAVQEFVVERISPFIVGDYISPDSGGTPVRQYVAVKFLGQYQVNYYPIDVTWAIVHPGDTVIFTPEKVNGRLRWQPSFRYAASAKDTPTLQ